MFSQQATGAAASRAEPEQDQLLRLSTKRDKVVEGLKLKAVTYNLPTIKSIVSGHET